MPFIDLKYSISKMRSWIWHRDMSGLVNWIKGNAAIFSISYCSLLCSPETLSNNALTIVEGWEDRRKELLK